MRKVAGWVLTLASVATRSCRRAPLKNNAFGSPGAGVALYLRQVLNSAGPPGRPFRALDSHAASTMENHV